MRATVAALAIVTPANCRCGDALNFRVGAADQCKTLASRNEVAALAFTSPHPHNSSFSLPDGLTAVTCNAARISRAHFVPAVQRFEPALVAAGDLLEHLQVRERLGHLRSLFQMLVGRQPKRFKAIFTLAWA